MKRIDIFMPPMSNYGILQHFTRKMHEAFLRNGIKSRILEAKRNDPGPFLKALSDDPPECTFSFNGLLPDDKGNFLSDMLDIPHVACLVDSPNAFIPLTKSKNTIVTCVDRASIDFFAGLGFTRTLFLPNGVEYSLSPDPWAKREYDVTMLASFIDYEKIGASWEKKYPAPLKQAMEEAAEISLNDPSLPYYQAFVQALDKQLYKKESIDPQKIDFISVLDDLETYICGKDRIELVKNITDAKVDIFGSSEGSGWKKYLGNQKNITIHDPVPFEQALEIMKHSKILLNSSPWIHFGAHERIFAGLASGALVIANKNDFLAEHFKEGESFVFYQPMHWDKANHRVNEYLENDNKRDDVAAKGREIVMKSHTWDQRAATLIKELPPILKTLR